MPVLDLPSAKMDTKAKHCMPPVAMAVLRGEDASVIEALALECAAERDFLYVLSVMCFPDDPDEVVRLKFAIDANEMDQNLRAVGNRPIISYEKSLLIAHWENGRHLLGHVLDRDLLGHLAAGWILRWIVAQRLHGDPAMASLRRGAEVFGKWCSNNRHHGGTAPYVRSQLWPKYRSVAHLWAALHMMQEVGWRPSTPPALLFFFNTAQWLLERGAEIVPKGGRTGEAVLNLATAWSPPADRVHRMPDGSISMHIWDPDPGAHKIPWKPSPASQLA